jgi:hypothetical protein
MLENLENITGGVRLTIADFPVMRSYKSGKIRIVFPQ